jgi:phosphopantetheinyl transferase
MCRVETDVVTVYLMNLDPRWDGDLRGGDVSPEELRRAARMPNPVERRRYLAGRRHLRAILAARVGCHPQELRIRTTDNGKPVLEGHDLHFSVARRAKHYAVAVSRRSPVGVDVEHVSLGQRAQRPLEHVVPGLVPATSRETATSTHDHFRQLALEWCRVEAAVKACGATLDAAAECLSRAPQRTRLVWPDLVLAVAIAGSDEYRSRDHPYDVEWLIC